MVALPGDQGEPLLKALHEAGVEQARVIGGVAPLEDAIHLTFK